jgi:hypothetical protein
MDIPIEIQLFPAWDGAVAEDEALQEKAAQRLSDYINGGNTRINGVGLRLFAEPINPVGSISNPARHPWGIKITGSVRTEVVFK